MDNFVTMPYVFNSTSSSTGKHGITNKDLNGSRFTVQLERPLDIPSNAKNVKLELRSASVLFDTPNISAEIGNNELKLNYVRDIETTETVANSSGPFPLTLYNLYDGDGKSNTHDVSATASSGGDPNVIFNAIEVEPVEFWTSDAGKYDLTTGAYLGAHAVTIGGTVYNGESVEIHFGDDVHASLKQFSLTIADYDVSMQVGAKLQGSTTWTLIGGGDFTGINNDSVLKKLSMTANPYIISDLVVVFTSSYIPGSWNGRAVLFEFGGIDSTESTFTTTNPVPAGTVSGSVTLVQNITLTIPDGNYTTGSLSDKVQQLLTTVTREDSTSRFAPNSIIIAENLATQKVNIALALGMQVDTAGSSVATILGFQNNPTLIPTYGGQVFTAMDVAQLNRVNQYLIHSDLVQGGIPNNGTTNNVIAEVPITAAAGYPIYYQPYNPFKLDASHLTQGTRTSVTFYLTDEQNRPASTGAWIFSLVMSYTIRSMS